jgi:hypothetical protein
MGKSAGDGAHFFGSDRTMSAGRNCCDLATVAANAGDVKHKIPGLPCERPEPGLRFRQPLDGSLSGTAHDPEKRARVSDRFMRKVSVWRAM